MTGGNDARIESGTNRSSQSFRSTIGRLPMSWIIAGVVFYCASLITVGLLAGLVPRRTQQITVLATPSQISSTWTTDHSDRTSTEITTTFDPQQCIEDECLPRLSSDIQVDQYELNYLYNNTNQTTVQGQVTITFTVKQPIKQLIYHAKRILLEPPALFEDGVNRLVTMRLYAPNDYVSLSRVSNSLFAPNRYVLVQNFVVSLTDGNVGFYQSVYNDGNGTTGKLIATKFQPTDARKAFPCFDEPKLKAIFKIRITHPENTIALANFPVKEDTVENGLRQTVFQDTFPMSTYLAAWAVVANTYGREMDDPNEPMVTVWARQDPTSKGHTKLALEIASKSVAFFINYFNTSAPVTPKIDLLAVPDFASGAMENWGLVSFREDRLIFDGKIASLLQKQQLGETISHEIAHFWFGNYVTCKWWDDLWLNEAMATWLSYKLFTADYPDWNMELQALTEEVIPVMWDDAKPSSHPIVVQNVTSAAQITSLFDSITYSKGASILRMLEKTVGSEVFRNGLRDYLIINAFDVGDPSGFYNNLFANMSGEEFMKNWLEELNYPILSVSLKTNSDETQITFKQSRFIISNALNSSHLNSTYRWKINVQCVLGGKYNNSDTVDIGRDTIHFFLNTEQEIRTLPGKSYTWIKCNQGFQGFYVSEYSYIDPTLIEPLTSSSWQSFQDVLLENSTFFSDEDKVNLLQDSFLLAYKGLVDYNEPLRIVSALVSTRATQFVLWRTFQWHWDTLTDLVEHLPSTWTLFKDFAIQQILYDGKSIDDVLTITPSDSHNSKLVKGLDFALLCRMDTSEAIEKAKSLFRLIPVGYFNNTEADPGIDANFLSTVYTCHLSHDDNEADWQLMYNYYKTAESPQEQTRALTAISSSQNTTRLLRLLEEGLNGGPNSIKRQDYFSMINYMSHNPIGRDIVWTFYKTNYQKFVDTFTLENRRFGAAIFGITRTFEKESYREDMLKFFELYPDAGAGETSRKQALDQVNMNIEWVKSREANLANALDITPRKNKSHL